MDAARLAYLSRYLFLILLALGVWRLLTFSLKQIRARIRLREASLPGYFLLLRSRPEYTPKNLPSSCRLRQRGGHSMLSFPLYPTTILGRASSCDLCFRLPELPRRAAIFYRSGGDWYLRPASNLPVYYKKELLTGPVLLESRASVQIGKLELTFIDERVETERLGRTYDEAQAEVESGTYNALVQAAKTPEERVKLADTLTRSGPWVPWLSMNAFLALCYLLQYLLFPTPQNGQLGQVAIYAGVTAFLLNLYFLILPFTTPNFDRTAYLAFGHLVILGQMVQFRLNLVNRSQMIHAKLSGDMKTYYSLFDYVMDQYLTQQKALILGLAVLPLVYLLVSRTRLVERLMGLCLVLTPLLYVTTLVLGRDPGGHGARLWLSLGGFSLQLTEFAKVTYLIVLAGFFKIRPRLRLQLAFGAWAALNFFLIMLLPDLGSVMILLPTTLVVYVMMTSEYLRAGILLLAGSGMSAVAYLLFPYVQNRIYGWTSLWTEINPRNEQIVFGLQAVARGGLLGRGIGNGSPAGIPEAGGDMVFSVFCEEWGLIAGLLLVLLFLVLWLRAVYVALESEDGFSAGLTLGIATLLFCEAMAVIGGSTGLIPLTGATLPFIAKGGSSLLSKCILVACLLGLSGRPNRHHTADFSRAAIAEPTLPANAAPAAKAPKGMPAAKATPATKLTPSAKGKEGRK